MGYQEPDTALQTSERRAYQRIPLELRGRFMRADRSEFDCVVRDISGSGMSLIADEIGEIGERVVAYISEIGRLEGDIIRVWDNGFAIHFAISPFKREKLLRALCTLDNTNEADEAAARRHHRFVPERRGSDFTLPDGRSYPCEVIDMSLSGASIRVGVIPGIGTTVYLGKMRGTVARHHPEGVAIEFTDMPDLGTLADHFGGGSLGGLKDLDA
jgi:hypothetical protein